MKLLQPSEELAAIIGDEPMSPAQAVEGLWGYIRENGLQDAKNPRRIKADENLGTIFGGKDQVTVLELARLVNRRLSAGPEGEAATDEELWRELEEQVLASAYETLGSPEMSDEELKQKYRELSREYHPDRLAGEEVPAGITKLVEEGFRRFRAPTRWCWNRGTDPISPYPLGLCGSSGPRSASSQTPCPGPPGRGERHPY